MLYGEVCASNQLLYAELEQLSEQILHPKLADKLNIGSIQQRRTDVKSLIESNLEWMEYLWGNPVEYRQAKRKNMKVPALRELYIIRTYQANPSITMVNLGAIAKVSSDTANRVITAYLTKKYSLPASLK